MNELLKKTAFLVLSCDKYEEAWLPYFLMFEKYWPDCCFNIYLATNTKKFDNKKISLKINMLFSNKFTTWSDETLTILKQIKEEYLIISLEDYFIYKKVNTSEIIKCLEIMEKENAVFFRLAVFPKKYDAWWPCTKINDFYGYIHPNSEYLVCLQIAIWRKSFLENLLVKEENPYQFEINGSNRARNLAKLNPNYFLCIIERNKRYFLGPITYYCTGITNGKWERKALKLLRKNNINFTPTQLQTKNFFENIFTSFYIFLPLKLRRVLDKFLKISNNFIKAELIKLSKKFFK